MYAQPNQQESSHVFCARLRHALLLRNIRLLSRVVQVSTNWIGCGVFDTATRNLRYVIVNRKECRLAAKKVGSR